jgi:hypothetical protein
MCRTHKLVIMIFKPEVVSKFIDCTFCNRRSRFSGKISAKYFIDLDYRVPKEDCKFFCLEF